VAWGGRSRSLALLALSPTLTCLDNTARADDFHYVARSGRVYRITPVTTPRKAHGNVPAPSNGDKTSLPPVSVMIASARWRDVVSDAANAYRLPEALLLAMIEVESGFNPMAVSESGAMGLMQLLPSTAAELGVVDPFDGRQNVRGGARYLSMLAVRVGPVVTTVLAGYHAGPGAVLRWGGVPPIEKTHRYITKVLTAYERWQTALAPPTAPR